MTTEGNRRDIFLHEMGVGPIWTRRTALTPGADPVLAGVVDVLPVSAAPIQRNAPEPAWSDDPAPEPLPIMSSIQPATSPSLVPIADMDYAQLASEVANCTKCGLCRDRTQTVFGIGDRKAKWLFIGEGPGHKEDLQGEPFVGPAGKLLDNMLLAMGLRRGLNAYITNILKCRATDGNGRDRPPTPEESAACMPYLARQIALIQPTVIVALGKSAALSLLQLEPDVPVSKLRGQVHRYAQYGVDLPLIVTYHPAYLLRTLADKRKTWADLCLAMRTYATLEQ